MSIVKNIKGIDDETWAEFKSLAARNKMKAASMFKVLVKEYQKKTSNFWDEILSHKSALSAKEQAELEKRTKQIREEHGWRI